MWNEPLNECHLSVLPRDRYPEPSPLPEGFSFIDEVPRSVERELLSSEFPNWRTPYERRFPGAREDSLVAVAKGDLVVGLIYLVADNEIDWMLRNWGGADLDLPNYGQIHYAVIRPEFRGRGLLGVMVTRLFERATSWGLAGVVLMTNREGLPEVHIRVGALEVGTSKRMGDRTRARRILGRFVNPHRRVARRAEAVLREVGATTSSPGRP